jgi:3-oxoacyl-[acyl-carrier protein] reductase
VNCASGDIGAVGGNPNPNNALNVAFEDIKVLTENNLIGTMLLCQAFAPPMKAAGSGVVVNISSAAEHMSVSPEVVYASLKAGVVHRSRCLAKELMEDGERLPGGSASEVRQRPGAAHRRRFVAVRGLTSAPLRRGRRHRCPARRAQSKIRKPTRNRTTARSSPSRRGKHRGPVV